MSERQEIISLKAPTRRRTEQFASAGHVCPYCNGAGVFLPHKEDDAPVCPDCEGTGELMAVVTVEWKPNKTRI